MNMTNLSAAQRFLNVQALLAQIRTELTQIDWAEAECNDVELGKHVVALEQHIDNAVGRSSTIRQTIRRSQAAMQD